MVHFLLHLVGWQMLHALFSNASQDSRYCPQVMVGVAGDVSLVWVGLQYTEFSGLLPSRPAEH